jgi:hypothetical protein
MSSSHLEADRSMGEVTAYDRLSTQRHIRCLNDSNTNITQTLAKPSNSETTFNKNLHSLSFVLLQHCLATLKPMQKCPSLSLAFQLSSSPTLSADLPEKIYSSSGSLVASYHTRATIRSAQSALNDVSIFTLVEDLRNW